MKHGFVRYLILSLLFICQQNIFGSPKVDSLYLEIIDNKDFDSFHSKLKSTYNKLRKEKDYLTLKSLQSSLQAYSLKSFSSSNNELVNYLIFRNSLSFDQKQGVQQLGELFETTKNINLKCSIAERLINVLIRYENPPFDIAHNYLKDLESDLLIEKSDSLWSEFYFTTYDYHLHKKEKLEAFNAMLKARKHSKRSDRKFYDIEYHITIFYRWIQDYPSSIELSEKYRALALEDGKKTKYLYFCMGLLTDYQKLKNYDKLKQTAQEAFEVIDEIKEDSYAVFIYEYLGNAYLEEENLFEATKYFTKGVEEGKRYNSYNEISQCYKGLGKVALEKENNKKAFEYFDLAKSYNREYDLELNTLLADQHVHRNNIGMSLELYKANVDHLESEVRSLPVHGIASSLLKQKFVEEKIQNEKIQKEKIKSSRQKFSFILWGIVSAFLVYTFYNQKKINTKLFQLNTSLNSKSEMVKQFAYMTAHDLQEPARNVSNFSELLERKLNTYDIDNQSKSYLDIIKTGSKSLLGLISNLKVFANIDFEKPEVSIVDLEQAISIVKENLSQEILDKNAEVIYAINEEVKTVKYSKELLILLIQNLVFTGITFNDDEKPSVFITSQKIKDEVKIIISDNGNGVPDNQNSNNYNSYQSSPWKALSVCMFIAEKLNSELSYENLEPKGTKFSISLNNC